MSHGHVSTLMMEESSHHHHCFSHSRQGLGHASAQDRQIPWHYRAMFSTVHILENVFLVEIDAKGWFDFSDGFSSNKMERQPERPNF